MISVARWASIAQFLAIAEWSATDWNPFARNFYAQMSCRKEAALALSLLSPQESADLIGKLRGTHTLTHLSMWSYVARTLLSCVANPGGYG